MAATAQLTAKPESAPEVRPALKALILFNEKAGSVSPADRPKLEAIAAERFKAFEFAEMDSIGRDLFRRARKFDVIVVLGGDGTARSVAEHATSNAPPLILLPGGTLNVLPKALYGNLSWPDALEAALTRGKLERLSMGMANGEPFFVAALFGAPTLLARAREAVREGRYLRAIRRFRHFVQRGFSHRLRARPGRSAPMDRAEAIGVLCPAYSGGRVGDALEWVRLTSSGMLDLLSLGVKALGPSWRDDARVELHTCRDGDIVSPGLIPATLDGEPKTFVSRVRITFTRNGPRVIVIDPEEGK